MADYRVSMGGILMQCVWVRTRNQGSQVANIICNLSCSKPLIQDFISTAVSEYWLGYDSLEYERLFLRSHQKKSSSPIKKNVAKRADLRVLMTQTDAVCIKQSEHGE